MKQLVIFALLLSALIPSVAFGVPWLCLDRTDSADDFIGPKLQSAVRFSSLYLMDNTLENIYKYDDITCESIYYIDAISCIFWRQPIWQEATETESCFFHANDPASLSGYLSGSSVVLNWRPDRRYDEILDEYPHPAGKEITGYRIERLYNGAVQRTWTVGSSVISDTDTPVLGLQYQYKIYTVWNDDSESPYSGEKTISTSYVPDTYVWLDSITPFEKHTSNTFTAIFHAWDLAEPDDPFNPDVVSVRAYYNHQWNVLAGGSIEIDYVTQTISAAFAITDAEIVSSGTLGFAIVIDGVVFPSELQSDVNGAFSRIYTCSHNNRMISGSFAQYMMNPADETWRGIFQSTTDDAQTRGFTGIWTDDAADRLEIGWYCPRIPIDYSEGAFSAGVLTMLADGNVSGMNMYTNGMCDVYLDENVLAGATIETDGTVGVAWLNKASTIQRTFNRPGVHTSILSTTPQWYYEETFGWGRLTDYVSYCLIAPDPASGEFGYRPRNINGNNDTIELFSELFLDLGEPISSNDYASLPYNWACDGVISTGERGCTALSPGDLAMVEEVQCRRFDKGVVLLNIMCAGANIPIQDYLASLYPVGGVPATLYRVIPSNVLVFDGGRLTTEAISTATYAIESQYPEVLLNEPIIYPIIQPQPVVIPGGSVPVKIAIQANEELMSAYVYDFEGVTGSAIGNGPGVQLFDDGLNGGDLVANDLIYTGTGSSLPGGLLAGEYQLEVWSRALDDGLLAIDRYDFAFELPPVKFPERSEDTDQLYMQKSGHPYSADFFDAGDLGKLLVITVEHDNDDYGGQLFRVSNYIGGVPEFENREPNYNVDLNPMHRAVAAADYDRDGDVDFFVGSAAREQSRLYRNDTTVFTEVLDDLFMLPQYVGYYDVLNASWVDYDQDGWLDLTCTEMELTPQGGTTTYIDDLVPGLGLTLDTTAFIHHSIDGQEFVPIQIPSPWSFGHVWVDLDSDGDQDYVVANMVGYQNVVLINNRASNGTYGLVDQTSQWLAGNLPLPGKTVTTLDYDRDGLMDLVFGTWNGAVSDVVLLRNTGNGLVIDTAANAAFTAVPWQEFVCSGIAAEDIDLNGWDDIVVMPEGDSRPKIYFNSGPSGGWFQEIQSLMPAAGGISGAAIADYNGDGDPDLYVGSEEDEPFFYQNLPAGYEGSAPDPVPVNEWIKIELRAYPYSGARESVIGSKVRIFYGESEAQTKVVDGGQGRAGQKQPVLVFGLEGHEAISSLQITWPDGVQETREGAFTSGMTHVIERGIVSVESQQFTYTAYPGGADWIFQWTTNYHSDRRYDRVQVEYSDCGTSATLAFDTQGVEYEQKRSGNTYIHTVKWLNKCCVPHKPLIYRFRVYSGYAAPQSGNDYTSWQMFGPKTCVQQQ